jgi:purine-cytosine permease-like protein
LPWLLRTRRQYARGAGIQGIETRSIDWIPDNERHGKVWHQASLWFLGNFQYFTIPIGFIGPLAEDLNGVDISWIVGAVVTGVAYWLLTRNLDVAAEQAAIDRSDAELRTITSAAST